MAVKIRMKRIGSKKRPFYRIVVADSRAPRDGRFIEELGYYNPISNPKVFKVDAEKAEKWMATGAKPTETVAKLFKSYNVSEAAQNVTVEEAKEEVAENNEEVVENNEEVVEEVKEEVKEEVAAEAEVDSEVVEG